MSPKPKDPALRYLAKVDQRSDDECWPWTAGTFDKGYGAFRLRDKQVKAHRFGYELLVGEIPDGDIVCHTCDNPPCQNPNHWFLGSHRDNAHDRERKGRGRYRTVGPLPRRPGPGKARGERSPKTTLTQTDVRRVRQLYASGQSQDEIALLFPVSQRTISNIVRRVTWAHITD